MMMTLEKRARGGGAAVLAAPSEIFERVICENFGSFLNLVRHFSMSDRD